MKNLILISILIFTTSAFASKDCKVKQLGDSPNQSAACVEGAKKFCPSGYNLKQKPNECPPGKMCTAVMIDYCERIAAQ